MSKSKKVLCIALVLCLISMCASYLFLSSGGTVKINELNLVIPSGETIHVYEYRPQTATTENPAPAVIFSHGNDSTLQSHQDYAMELSRRGFVVFALDITSAGMSSPVSDASTVGFGVYDLVDYVYYSLNYVDNARIGIGGFSKGGNNVYDTMMRYGVEQRETPDEYVKRVSAALLIDPMFLPMNDFATGINVGFSCGSRSPYANVSFTQTEGYLPGDLTVKPEMKEFINMANPGTFSEEEINDTNCKVELGKVYGSLEDGTARIVYNPEYVTHATGLLAKAVIRDCVEFFDTTLGAPNPIPASDSNTRWHIAFAALGLLGIIMMIAPLACMLMDTKFFASLKKGENESDEPLVVLESGGQKALFIIPALIISFILPLTAVPFGQMTSKFLSLDGHAGVSRWFLNSWQNSIMFWLTMNALIALVISAIIYVFVHKKNGISLRSVGICADLKNTLKAILLAVVVFVLCYLVTCFAQYTLKVDFRFQDLTFPVMTWSHLLLCMRYAPFVIFFWCVNSINMNAFNRIKGMSEKKNLALCVALNIIGLVVVLAIHYTKLFTTGAGLSNPMRWKYYTTCLLFIPIAISGTIINRVIYNKTHNVFVGPLVFGTVATIFSTAVMMLPDYIY